jgi:hypothetical protein
MMQKLLMSAAAAALLAGCSGGGEAEKPKAEAKATALQPGEYELSAKVDSIRSTDNTTPASQLTMASAPETRRACVAPDNAIDPAMFIEAGETCTASSSYVSRGRMSLQYNCDRPGKGKLTQLVDGEFKADSFTARVQTATFFASSGDYALTRTITGRRVGECPAAGAAEAAQ